ncbi:MAG TPA: capsular biosynthesis protein [Sulfurovum sp. UBA12169]|nr:MAG TPA: capsular biosynthesis protein [Sulfurovum sp. UBA12169]
MIPSFFKKRKAGKPVTAVRVDVHSHLIPGIDDGAQNMQESLALLGAMQSLGYEKVITTPHVMADAYGNTKESIQKGLGLLQKEAQKSGLTIQIEAAAEYYLDEGLLSLIEKDELLLVGGEYLLFETSYTHRPNGLERVIFEILAAGYKPLLAHPERYRYIQEPHEEYSRLKALGVFFQLNINSLGGYYGKGAKKAAEFLCKEGMVDFLGSDAHHQKHTDFLEKVFATQAYAQLWKNNTILNESLR